MHTWSILTVIPTDRYIYAKTYIHTGKHNTYMKSKAKPNITYMHKHTSRNHPVCDDSPSAAGSESTKESMNSTVQRDVF